MIVANDEADDDKDEDEDDDESGTMVSLPTIEDMFVAVLDGAGSMSTMIPWASILILDPIDRFMSNIRNTVLHHRIIIIGYDADMFCLQVSIGGRIAMAWLTRLCRPIKQIKFVSTASFAEFLQLPSFFFVSELQQQTTTTR
jgi:hypothetical protein